MYAAINSRNCFRYYTVDLVLWSETKVINADVVGGYAASQNSENAPEFNTKDYDIMLNYTSIIA